MIGFSRFGPLSKYLPQCIIFNDALVPSRYILIAFVHRTKACTVTWQNGIALKKALASRLEINLSKFVFLNASIRKRVKNSRIIKFDRSSGVYFLLMDYEKYGVY